MTEPRADIIMITYRSAGYLHLSLPRLLDTCGENDRVWLWHNGDDEETLEALRPYRKDDRVHRFHHSRENVRLRQPTSWLWSGSNARFVSKVDDDCLVESGWLDTFAAAHDDNPEFGVIGSWRHPDEDLIEERTAKIKTFRRGHQLMCNLWVQGSGYLMKRSLVERHGPLKEKKLFGSDESFTKYCVRLAKGGAVNGFYYPFVPEDHMDDPRSPHTLIRSDQDLQRRMPLSAQANGVRTVDDWLAQLKRSAEVLQTASPDPGSRSWIRRKRKRLQHRITVLTGRTPRW